MKKIFFLPLLFIVSGCATVSVARYDKNVFYPAVEPQSIQVFQKKPEDRKFTEIGEITVDGVSNWAQAERIFRIKAAEFGGDAVYVYKTTEHATTYSRPHECHFDDGFFYRHGRYFPYRGYYYPYSYGYYPRYYYCYGYGDTQSATFLTVVGIIIKYTY